MSSPSLPAIIFQARIRGRIKSIPSPSPSLLFLNQAFDSQVCYVGIEEGGRTIEIKIKSLSYVCTIAHFAAGFMLLKLTLNPLQSVRYYI